MIKKLSIFLVSLCIASIGFARFPTENWTLVEDSTLGASSTTLVTATTGSNIILTECFVSVQNACNFYFYTGSKSAVNKLTPIIYLGANGGWDKLEPRKLNIVAPVSTDLQVWFNTDPGTDILVNYKLETPR